MKNKIVIGLIGLILAGFGSDDASHAQWMLVDLFPDDPFAPYLQSWLTQSPVASTYNCKFEG